MTDKLIEAVARAIHTGLGDISVSGSRHAARAAIAAIEASGTHRVVPLICTDSMVEPAWEAYAERMGRACANIYFIGDVVEIAIAAAPKVAP